MTTDGLHPSWLSCHLTLDGKGGGILTIGTTTYDIRNWQKLGNGQAKFEASGQSDPHWDAYLERLYRSMRSG